jgi:hypothetical protein
MAAVMVPGFEALAAVLSVLSRGAEGGRVFRILSGKYPEYLAENAVPFRGERALWLVASHARSYRAGVGKGAAAPVASPARAAPIRFMFGRPVR